MKSIWTRLTVGLIGLLAAPLLAGAATVPFTEDFFANVANWSDNTGLNLLSYAATGGPDGGAYAATGKALTGLGGQSVVLFRAQDEFNSSNHAFEGNWVGQNIGRFSAMVRHNAPVPLSYFARFSSPANFPGGTAVKFAPVLPNTWTQLNFDINAANPEFVTFEGSSFGAVFSNIGHIQLGVSAPQSLTADATVFQFGIDKASITLAVPEPATAVIAIVAGFLVVGGRRRIPRRRSGGDLRSTPATPVT